MTSRWISFDCYGTLVDWLSGFRMILEPVAGQLTGKLLDAYHDQERLVEAERPLHSYKEVLALSLSLGASELGLVLTEAQANSFSREWDRLPVFEDVEPMLAELRSAGWKLAVLTNCDVDLFERTQRCFKQPFDLVVTAERVRDYKPAAAHFKYFREQTDVHTEDWIHVACSWFHDIVPARGLGIRHVWLNREGGQEKEEGTLQIRSANGLKQAIDSIGTRAS